MVGRFDTAANQMFCKARPSHAGALREGDLSQAELDSGVQGAQASINNNIIMSIIDMQFITLIEGQKG